ERVRGTAYLDGLRHARVLTSIRFDVEGEALAPAGAGVGQRPLERLAVGRLVPRRKGSALERAAATVRSGEGWVGLDTDGLWLGVGGWREQLVGREAAPFLQEEAGLRRVFQHAAHKVRHAREQLAGRDIVAGGPA